MKLTLWSLPVVPLQVWQLWSLCLPFSGAEQHNQATHQNALVSFSMTCRTLLDCSWPLAAEWHTPLWYCDVSEILSPKPCVLLEAHLPPTQAPKRVAGPFQPHRSVHQSSSKIHIYNGTTPAHQRKSQAHLKPNNCRAPFGWTIGTVAQYACLFI